PASVGVHTYVNHLYKDERVEFALFWSGLRALWAKSLLLCAIGVAGGSLLGINLYFYVQNESQILRYVAIIWFYAIVVWSMMLLYMNPLPVEQENKSFRLIIRH